MTFKKGKFGGKGKKRKNMPGYHLGYDKIGRKAWLADQEVKQIYNKDKYLSGEMKVGDIVKLSATTNATVLGSHKGLAVIFDPTTAHVRLTSFAKQPTVVVRKNIDVLSLYPSLLKRKIMGTDITVAELVKSGQPQASSVSPPKLSSSPALPPTKPAPPPVLPSSTPSPSPQSAPLYKKGDVINLVDYHPQAVVGDVLINSKGNDWTVIGVTKNHLIVKSAKLPYPYAIKVSSKLEYRIKQLGQDTEPPLLFMQKKIQAASKFIGVPGQPDVKHTLKSFLLQEGGHVLAPHLKKNAAAQVKPNDVNSQSNGSQVNLPQHNVVDVIAGKTPALIDLSLIHI